MTTTVKTRDTEVERERPGDTELYPIGAVADITGVNPITLRAWERRHRLIEPIRTPTGRRLYSPADIALIERVVALLDRGMRIGQVKDELDAQDRRDAATAADGDPWNVYLSRMTAAIIRFDEVALEEVYNSALSLYPIDDVTRELLTPLLVALGERWQSGTGSVAEEHFFGFYLRNKLGARFHHRPRGNTGLKILAACLPHEQHENGLLLLSLALHERGFRVISLGSNLPLDELPAAARQSACDAVVLSGSLEPEPELLARRLPRVVADAGVPVIVGGAASVRCQEAIRAAGAEPVGEDLERGIAMIEDLLDVAENPATGRADRETPS
jgi:DNA-binding transcriptional MerR regulator/methylmalonyl-CoA mutase cobalamin-binding subunit